MHYKLTGKFKNTQTREQTKLAHVRKKGSSKGETGHTQEDNTDATQNKQGQEDDKLVLW